MTHLAFDQMEGNIWFDGALVPWQDARLHILTHGLHYGSTVFEGNRLYEGEIFKLTQHSERLHQSAAYLGYEVPYSVAAIDQACRDVVAANGLRNAYVRPVAWRGSESMTVASVGSTIHLAIACWAMGNYFQDRMRGIRLQTSQWRRPSPECAPVHAKAAGLYMICTLAKNAAEAQGYDDALMLDYRGRLAEATGANLFLFMDGKLHTPEADCFLSGITRQTVIELAQRQGMETVERAILPDELRQASEVFLTGTAAEITPVREIDGHAFNPGRVCETLLAAYDREVGKNR